MDGRGRFLDNVFIERLWRSLKPKDVYLKSYADGREARAGIASWISFYNGKRPHQAHGGRTPMAVWRAGTTGEHGGRAVDMMDNADCRAERPIRLIKIAKICSVPRETDAATHNSAAVALPQEIQCQSAL
jgi:Integrase core domain